MYTDRFIKSIENAKIKTESSSIKFCHLASSEANLYPRFTKINKWDIAAGHALVKSSGGFLETINGNEFNYMTHSPKADKFIASVSKDWRKKVNIRDSHE